MGDDSVFEFSVKLLPNQWFTRTIHGDVSCGFDVGGAVELIPALASKVERNENLGEYQVSRIVEKAMFAPRILQKGQKVPDDLATSEGLSSLKFGTTYNIYISFKTEEEAALFSLSNSTNVSIDFR